MLKIGAENIVALYRGNTEFQQAYLGNTLVFENAPIYTISATIDPKGSGTVTGAGQYKEGTQVTIKANPEDGYEFVAWKEFGSSRLPEGYTELEYIQGTGTQYINTGFDPTTKTKSVLDLKITDTAGTFVPFGAKVDSITREKQYFVMAMGSRSRFEANYFSLTEANLVNLADYKERGTLSLDKSAISFNDSSASLSYTAGDNEVPHPIYLFGYDLSGSLSSPASMALYSCQIYESETLVRDFIPCTDTSGAVGLYDLIDGVFYANAGTGTFTAGPEVSEDVTVSEDAEYTFTVSADRTLIAVFEELSKYVAGVDWWESTLPSSAYWESVTYGNGKYVAVESGISGSAKGAYSADGITWAETKLPISGKWESITYGDGRFVAIIGGSSKSSQAAYSADGMTWATAKLPFYIVWGCVAYGGGKFIAITGTGSAQAAYSANGITWSAAYLPSSAKWRDVTYGDGKYVAIAKGTTKAAYSTDGITWTTVYLPSSANWSSITYGGDKFVAISGGDITDSKVAYSLDGITWTEAALPASTQWKSVTYGAGQFVAVGQNNAAYSADGVTWTKITMPSTGQWKSVTCGDSKFVAIAHNSNKAAYSSAKGPGV